MVVVACSNSRGKPVFSDRTADWPSHAHLSLDASDGGFAKNRGGSGQSSTYWSAPYLSDPGRGNDALAASRASGDPAGLSSLVDLPGRRQKSTIAIPLMPNSCRDLQSW